jgi:hypothetical protein
MRPTLFFSLTLALSIITSGASAEQINEQWLGFWDSTDGQFGRHLIVTSKNIVDAGKICKWVGKAPARQPQTGCVSFYEGTTSKKEMLAVLQTMRENLRIDGHNMDANDLAEEKKLVDVFESNVKSLSDRTFRKVTTWDADYEGSGDCRHHYYIMDQGIAYSVLNCESAGMSSALILTPLRKGSKTGPVTVLNGDWISKKWKYGYTLDNGLGTATATNSTKFKVGDEIIILRATGKNTFEGEQIYQDGKFYSISASLLPDGRLQFKGDKNVNWTMERR